MNGQYISPKRTVLRYHGGKWLLAPWIISHFPKHRIYTEVFGGAFNVGMRKRPCYCEVYNDRWDLVVNVFKVLRDPESAARLKYLLKYTPYARTEFESCGSDQIHSITDPVEKARRTILRSLAGFGSASTRPGYSTGFRANSNRSGTTPSHDFKNYIDHIEIFTNRLRGLVIENRDAKEALLQHDTNQTLHYVDPPYVHSTRQRVSGKSRQKYAFEMTDDDHRELADVINSLEGMVIISGYASDLYDEELYPEWTRVVNKTFADGAIERKEVLWINDAAQKARGVLTLF